LDRSAQAHGVRESILLNALWAPLTLQDAAVMAIAVPAVLLRIAPERHATVLAYLVSLAAVVSMIVPPVAATVSDRIRRAGGQRRAMVLVGVFIDGACLLTMTRADSVVTLTALLLLATAGLNISIAAYQAMIPEVVPRSEWRAASGIRGAASLIGSVIGFAVAGLGDAGRTLVFTALVVIAGAFTLFGVPEGRWADPEHAHVRDWHDFVLVFVSRFWIVFGLTLLMTFVLYFFSDVIKLGNPSAGTALVGVFALVGAIASSIWLGRLSDRVSRKVVVALAGAPMALAAIGFAVLPQERWILAFAVLFGLGYGGVVSTGWALAIDAMPQLRDIARDLGIWGIAQNLPVVVAPVFGGWLLANYGGGLFAYQLLFAAAGISFALGSVVVLGVRGRTA
jgi:MFS family permease